MTTFLYRSLLVLAFALVLAPFLKAEDIPGQIEVFSGGRSYGSFREYAERDQAPKALEVPAEEEDTDPLSRYVARWDLSSDFADKELTYYDPIAHRVVAGISPSFGDIVKGFNSGQNSGDRNNGETHQIQRANLEHVTVLRSPDALAEALAQAAHGKEGALLVVADKSRVRIMGLTHNSVDLPTAQ